MSELAWSLILDSLGVIPILLARKKKPVAWLISISLMWLWIAYALARGGYGFIPGSIVYQFFYYSNWKQWRADDLRRKRRHVD